MTASSLTSIKTDVHSASVYMALSIRNRWIYPISLWFHKDFQYSTIP